MRTRFGDTCRYMKIQFTCNPRPFSRRSSSSRDTRSTADEKGDSLWRVYVDQRERMVQKRANSACLLNKRKLLPRLGYVHGKAVERYTTVDLLNIQTYKM